MAKIFDQKITKKQDWGGDASTGGLPVSGRVIQEFLKENLESRFGCLHSDTANSRYLVFADAENRDLYLSNPVVHNKLLLGTFLAPSEYSATITLLSLPNNNIFVGQKNNYIEFTFDVVNKSGASTGESVICNYTIIRGNDKKTITESYKNGTAVRFNLDDHLQEGINRVTINVIGVDTLAGTSIGVTYNMIQLELKDTFNIGKNNPVSGSLEIPYYVSGAGVKRMEWFLDGVQLVEEQDDTVTPTSTNRIKVIPYQNLSHGNHTLQFRTYVELNGEKFYSKTFFKSFMVIGALYDPVIGYSCVLPTGTIIAANAACKVTGIIQYEAYDITYSIYDPRGASSLVSITNGGKTLSTVAMTNGETISYPFRSVGYGIQTLVLSSNNTTQTLTFEIIKSPYNIEESTNALTLDLRADGRSNLDPNKDKWVWGGISSTFTGFKWNQGSGWNGKTLQIKGGSTIAVNFKPFAADIKSTGITLEFAYKVTNIIDSTTQLIACKDGAGTGISVTASEIKMMSSGNRDVKTFFKAGEEIRVSFVIHRSQSDNLRQMMIIYVNGVMNAMTTYLPTDSFINDSIITIGSSNGGADMDLTSVRAYSRALSPEEVLNNYILYQDSIDNMLSIYDKNNIYEDGTFNLSIDKISARVPVMIFTGNVPVILNTKDKNTTIYLDEIKYINLQNPELQFHGTGVRLRPQGTSSMAYPIKNFRYYLNYGKVFNNKGEAITKTQIRSTSIPVSTFCLKADYAESSGTHNTGVARLWNNALYNVQLDNEYVCRTNAQKAALANKYPYDVRTAIDGHPIVLFYRLTQNSPLVFLGHYNLNNDKSTEEVFGFRDIPTFDNTKVACWEHLNNTHPLGLFSDILTFDTNWKEAFEARYPENFNPAHLQALKDFSTWVNSTKGNPDKFKSEKAAHIHLPLMAAYYCYVMRFGAVDQIVKNAMLTTEDGIHYYYIHYDNDTINGLRNDGLRAYGPDIDRQTVDADFSTLTYCYAGHDSVLWNNLEADSEFMDLVKRIDNALYMAGMSYREVIDMFDNKQMSKWSERIYNEDQKMKYIRPMLDEGINNLFMAQGNRQQHRRYWLSNRFTLYDGKFVSGEYKSSVIEFKVAGGEGSFQVVSGRDNAYFGYGINNIVIESGHKLNRDQSVTFTTPRVLAIGDPVRIYAAHFVKKVDISAFQGSLAQITISSVAHPELGSIFEELILGTQNGTNSSLTEISGLQQASKLKKLDIRGFQGLSSLDLSKQFEFVELLASGSGIRTLSLPKGAPVSILDLPSQTTLVLESLPLLTNANLTIADNGITIRELTIKDCPQFDSKSFVFNWITNKTAAPSSSILTLAGINWNVTYTQLQQLKNSVGTLNLIGVINVSDTGTQAMIDWITANFGSGVFNTTSPFRITLPDGIFISGPSSVNFGSTVFYTAAIFPSIAGDSAVYTLSSSVYAAISTDGILRVNSGFDGDKQVTLTVYSKLKPSNLATKSITLVGYTYPSSGSITGEEILSYGPYPMKAELSPFTGPVTYTWSLDIGATTAIIEPTEAGSCNVNVLVTPPEPLTCTLTCVIKHANTDATLLTLTKALNLFDPNILCNRTTNSYLCDFMFSKGYSATNQKVMKEDALKVVGEFPTGLSSYINSFDELMYFTNVTSLPVNFLSSCSYLKSVRFPNSITSLPSGCLSWCNNLGSVDIPANIATIATQAFISSPEIVFNVSPDNPNYSSYGGGLYNKAQTILLHTNKNPNKTYPSTIREISEKCFYRMSITSITIPEGVTTLGKDCFLECFSLTSVTLPSTLKTIGINCFSSTKLASISLPTGLTSIGDYAFAYTSLTGITLPLTVTTIGAGCFNQTSITSIAIPEGITILNTTTFQMCSSLTSVTLPSTLKTIEFRCFYECSKLTSITIPEGVTTIGDYIFEGCSSLSSIYMLPLTAPNTSYYKPFGDKESDYTGRNSYAAGTNRLYVATNATGYDTGEWLDPLCNATKCGFTLSKTL